MNKESKIYITGHAGLVGSAIVRTLRNRGYDNLVLFRSSELDLRDQAAVKIFFASEKPEYVFHAAGRVGGIGANSQYKAQFFYDNALMAINLIHAAYENGVTKLVNLGSSCIYPKFAEQPLKEEALLTGALEPTNDAYAVAKIAAIKMCAFYNTQYGTTFLSAMPCNLYGPGDNFNLETSHVLPALIRKMHEAKLSGGPVNLWGDGSPLREFLYVEDLAEALLFLMEDVSSEQAGELINIGSGVDGPIKDLAALIARIVGYTGEIVWDSTKPNGTPRKLLDVSRINALGWRAATSLEDGIRKTYDWYVKNAAG